MSHACTVAVSAPSPAAGPCWPTPPLENPGHSWAGLGQSLLGSLLLPPGYWCAQNSVCALQECISQFCISSGGSMVGLMETSSKKAYATPKSAAPRAPAPAAGHCWPGPPQETQIQFWLHLCGVSGSWCAQGLFEPFELLRRVWCLILNAVLPLLPSCWGFSPLDMGYLLTVSPVLRRNHRNRLTSNQMSKDFLGDEI